MGQLNHTNPLAHFFDLASLEPGAHLMAERRPTLMTPRMENLLDKVDSKFTLVTLSAMRAREINDYYNQLGEGLGKIVPPQVTSVSRKPLSISLEEIEVGKIEAIPLPSEEELEAAAVAEAAAAADAAADIESSQA
ncbi:MAG: DNA-directed RNA polymerase subunit omega [Acidimicrobiia bacterium]